MALQRKALLLGLLGLLGLVGLLMVARLVWRPSRDGAAGATTPTKVGVDTRVSSPLPSHAARPAPTLRPFAITKDETKRFRLEEAGRVRENEPPVYAKAREAARGAWDRFVRDAKPTTEQQQAILSAIYDAQLYRDEVDQVEGEWGTDWAYGDTAEAGPFPSTNWMQDIRDAVWTRAAEVLNDEQNKVFRAYCDLAIDLAVQGQLVQPAR